jgi:hypothetical protein
MALHDSQDFIPSLIYPPGTLFSVYVQCIHPLVPSAFCAFFCFYFLILQFLCLGLGSKRLFSVCYEADLHGRFVMVFGEEEEKDHLRSHF